VFLQLSDGTRLRLLLLLCVGERNVGELCDVLGQAQPTISHHLSLLRMSGLVQTRREGKRVFYRLADSVTCPAAGSVRIATAGMAVTLTTSTAPAR
jgi:DNA-binding transcriptional ArsR family regulator